MPTPDKLGHDGRCPCGKQVILVKSMASTEMAVIKSALLMILGNGKLVLRCRSCKRDLEIPPGVVFGKSLRFVVRKRHKEQQ
jgi:hypothetical protein